MDIMKDIYLNLKRQKKDLEAELAKKQEDLSGIPAEKQSIVIKKIRGELYYYAQWRKEGKVKSQFLSPVSPGVIAADEKVQCTIERLQKDIKELKINLENLDKMIVYLEKRRKEQKLMESYSFEVYHKDEITARVYVRAKEVIISRFTDNPAKQLFAQKKMTRYQLGKIFEMRCWDRGRADIDELLGHLGLTEYDPYEIVRKTHGVSYNDYIWFRFPGEKLTSKDVLVR